MEALKNEVSLHEIQNAVALYQLNTLEEVVRMMDEMISSLKQELAWKED
jgi:hypothetical protein